MLPNFAFSQKMDKEVYQGWTIEVEPFPKPTLSEFYELSFCFGQILATKHVAEGVLFLRQPMWMTVRQVKAAKTPIAQADSLDYMVKRGKQMIRMSIEKHKKGILHIDAMRDISKMMTPDNENYRGNPLLPVVSINPV